MVHPSLPFFVFFFIFINRIAYSDRNVSQKTETLLYTRQADWGALISTVPEVFLGGGTINDLGDRHTAQRSNYAATPKISTGGTQDCSRDGGPTTVKIFVGILKLGILTPPSLSPASVTAAPPRFQWTHKLSEAS
jgi:hypothetical protein